MHFSFRTFGKASLYFVLPLVVFVWSSVPQISTYTLQAALLCVVVAIALAFNKAEALSATKVVIHTLIVLLVVGSTGWFLSPFFYLMYLLPLYLGFLYTPAVAFSFLAALLLIFSVFSSGFGEVSFEFDVLTLLSLLLVIPLVIYLRKKYLVIRQTKKDILILEEEGGVKDMDTIEHLLANRVTNLGVTIRQPLTFLKQASTLLLEEDLKPDEATQYLERMKTTAAEALDQVRKFEGDTSANEVLTNQKTIIKIKK